MSKTGIVYLVGAGPGDPRLLTLRGKECIERADVIIYDRLISPRLLQYRQPNAELIYVGKDPHQDSLKQEDINRLLVEHSKKGKIVTRLKGGDPCVFGRAGEEALTLSEESIPFEIVPGITSAISVPAYAGIPVTHRGIASSFIVVTGHEDPTKEQSHLDWEGIASSTGTVVILMGIQNLAWIVDNLLLFGRPSNTPVALIRYGTRVEQETLTGTLETIVEEATRVKFRSPAIIVVGEVVNLRQQLSWYERLPLFGKRILITRARSSSSELAALVQELGGEPYEFPVIETRISENRAPIEQAIGQLPDYDWIVFTSAVGVQFFLQEMRRLKTDIRKLRGRLLAVGPKTAGALAEYGLIAEETPQDFRAEGLIELYGDRFQAGERVLLPRADLARHLLPEFLRQKGCIVEDLQVYETVASSENKEELLDFLERGSIHAITFTSSSTVHNFAKALGVSDLSAALSGVAIACIGPLTAETAKEYKLQVDVTADPSTIEGLLQGLVDYYIKENPKFHDPS